MVFLNLKINKMMSEQKRKNERDALNGPDIGKLRSTVLSHRTLRPTSILSFAVSLLLPFALVPIASSAPGDLDTGFTPPENLNGVVRSTTLQPDGKIIVGGGFSEVGGTATLDRFIRLNADGSLDTGFTPPEDLSGDVHSTTLQPDGKIIVGGAFVDVGGTATLDRLIRLNTDGSLDTGFTPPEDLNGGVFATSFQPDGKIIVGGAFADVGGTATLDRIIRLNADGSLDTGFTPPADISSTVFATALQPDGKILVGGSFVGVGGTATLGRIIRLNTNGSLDAGFIPPEDISGNVISISLQPDGKILAGGTLADAGGTATLDRIIRLNTNGSLDTGFTPPESLDFWVYSITVLPDGKIIVGGLFSDVGGTATLDRIIRLEAFTPSNPNTALKRALAKKIKKLKKQLKVAKRKRDKRKLKKLKKQIKSLTRRLRRL